MELYLIVLAVGAVVGLLLGFILGSGVEKRKRDKTLGVRTEVEARMMRELRDKEDRLSKENENLRIRVQELSNKPGNEERRLLKVYAFAERQMMLGAPGFAPSWEMAKAAGEQALAEEDEGKRLPNRVRSWIGLSTPKRDTLPDVRQD